MSDKQIPIKRISPVFDNQTSAPRCLRAVLDVIAVDILASGVTFPVDLIVELNTDRSSHYFSVTAENLFYKTPAVFEQIDPNTVQMQMSDAEVTKMANWITQGL